MTREKRRLSVDDAVGVEATCRAVKRLQISGSDSSSCNERQVAVLTVPYLSSQQIPNDAQQHLLPHSDACSITDTASGQDESLCQVTPGWPAHLSNRARDVSPVRAAPQRSLSSPDMSRFKFHLTSSKPPVHPESISKLLRQQSIAEDLLQTGGDGLILKPTSDRHCDQERLFHQLDQKLTLHAPQHQPISPTHSQRSPPFPSSVSMLSLVANLGPFQTQAGGTAISMSHRIGSEAVNMQDAAPMTHDQLHIVVDSSNSGELYQPSTPIRREDSPPVRSLEEHAVEESLFAAMYEQTNVLLRNLHFERLNRRATSA